MLDNSVSRTLLIHGTVLFLLGLLNGVLVQTFHNPQMGLSAHLAGVQNALVLWIFGLIWPRVSLSRSAQLIAAWSAIYSMYAIWLGLAIAGVFGASRSLPIAGLGYEASDAIEFIVAVLVYSGSAAIVVGTLLLLLGLWKKSGGNSAS